MDQHCLDGEFVGDVAGVLAAGAAKTVQRIAGHVIAARDRNFLDRLGHFGDGDGETDCDHHRPSEHDAHEQEHVPIE